MKSGRLALLPACAIAAATLALPAWAAAPAAFHLVIRNQAFTPDTLTIPAGELVEILVKNEDALPAEFESNDFNREVVIPGGTELPVYVGPLRPGTYTFFNDFHQASTGKLIVKAPAAAPPRS